MVSLNYYINHVFRVFALRQVVYEQAVLTGLKISVFMAFVVTFFLVNFTRNTANNSATQSAK